MRTPRAVGAAAVAAAGIAVGGVVGAAGVSAAPATVAQGAPARVLAAPQDSLPVPTDAELDTSKVPLDLAVQPFEPAIEPWETERRDGDQTVLSLRSDVLFAFGKADISGRAKAELATLVAGVPKSAAVSVGGHTDSIGSTQANLALSRSRAAAVAAVLHEARPDLRLTVQGFGESRPVAPNTSGGKDDPEGRAKNRRVEIRYAG